MDPNSANQAATEPDLQPRGGLPSPQGWLFRDHVGDANIPWLVLTIVCGVALIAEMGAFLAPTSLVLGIFFALLMPRNVAKGGFDEEEVVHVTPAGVVE
jgi:hypothetical protein